MALAKAKQDRQAAGQSLYESTGTNLGLSRASSSPGQGQQGGNSPATNPATYPTNSSGSSSGSSSEQ